ncbi:MAG: AcvB/VirJ family lysyl-phosphatidylglycerol hydrolase [Comamonas sp.]
MPLSSPHSRTLWSAPRRALAGMALAATAALAAPASPAANTATPDATPVAAPETFSHGYFDNAPVYRPAGEPRGVALLIAGEGWTRQDADLAESLRRQGVLTAGIDLPKMAAALRKDKADCLGPQGDLDNFSRFLQARYQLARYHQPVLVGNGTVGAAIAYGALATASHDTFSGAVSLGFAPDRVVLPLPLCKKDYASLTHALPRAAHADHKASPARAGHAYRFLPTAQLDDPWLVFPGADGAPALASFASTVPHATLMPTVITADTTPAEIEGPLASAFTRLQPSQEVTATPPAAVSDLPLVEAPPTSTLREHDLLAIMLSGDGGWAGIDKDLATAMNRAGIPVVGFDSLRYFWKARTPEGTAHDVERVIRYYQSQPAWKRARVLLVGYSQGADVLPFVVNRLSAEVRTQLASALLIGMGRKAAFEFHITNWIKASDGLPTLPEAGRMPPGLGLCAYGTEDSDAVCPQLGKPGSPVRILALKGGHHFDGNYDRLAEVLLKNIETPPARPAGAP